MGISTNAVIVILLLVIIGLVVIVSIFLRFLKEVFNSKHNRGTSNNNNNNRNPNDTQLHDLAPAYPGTDNRTSMMSSAGLFLISSGEEPPFYPPLPTYSACSFTSAPIIPEATGVNFYRRRSSQINPITSNNSAGVAETSNHPSEHHQSTTTVTGRNGRDLSHMRSPPPRYEDIFGDNDSLIMTITNDATSRQPSSNQISTDTVVSSMNETTVYEITAAEENAPQVSGPIRQPTVERLDSYSSESSSPR